MSPRADPSATEAAGEGVNKTVVRQANWQKVGGASPLWRKTNQLSHYVSRAQVPVRVQAKRR